MKCQRGSTLPDAHERTTIKLSVSLFYLWYVLTLTSLDVTRAGTGSGSIP